MRQFEQRLPVRGDETSNVFPWGATGFGGAGSALTGSPWQLLRRMQEDVDRVFGQFFGGTSGFGTVPAISGQWAPRTDISETGNEWCIEADLPGVNREDIDVQIRDHHLILRAELRQPVTEENDDRRRFHRKERQYGYFERVMPLPVNVNEDGIACDFSDGVLTIHVPKTSGTAPGQRRVPVMDAGRIPSETAGGRHRSQAELSMTSGGANGKPKASNVPTKGAKGGAARTPTTNRPAQSASRSKTK